MKKNEIPLELYENILDFSRQMLEFSRSLTDSCNKLLDFLTDCLTSNPD